MQTKLLIPFIGAAALLLGCPATDDPNASDAGGDDTEAAETESVDDDDSGTPTTTTTTAAETEGDPTETEGDPTETEGDPTEGETEGDTEVDPTMGQVTVTFLVDPDGEGPMIECDVWSQDCPAGQKCAPWANDGGNSWNATKCVDLQGKEYGQPGDECTVMGSGVSGVDDCDVSSMCWDVDGETNMGTCVAFCTGSDNNPVCDDPDASCSIANEGVLILCLPVCDPLLQDCADGSACYGLDDAFVCAPDASGEMGADDDPCEYLNACDPGLGCFNAAALAGCAGSSGCCSTFCETTEPNTCVGAGEECVPYFEAGNAPPGYEDVGFCGVPA